MPVCVVRVFVTVPISLPFWYFILAHSYKFKASYITLISTVACAQELCSTCFLSFFTATNVNIMR